MGETVGCSAKGGVTGRETVREWEGPENVGEDSLSGHESEREYRVLPVDRSGVPVPSHRRSTGPPGTGTSHHGRLRGETVRDVSGCPTGSERLSDVSTEPRTEKDLGEGGCGTG